MGDLLSNLKPGQRGRILRITGPGSLKMRLMEMGVVPGTTVEVKRVAPLGDPVEVEVKGYRMSLRREEAAIIEVEV